MQSSKLQPTSGQRGLHSHSSQGSIANQRTPQQRDDSNYQISRNMSKSELNQKLDQMKKAVDSYRNVLQRQKPNKENFKEPTLCLDNYLGHQELGSEGFLSPVQQPAFIQNSRQSFSKQTFSREFGLERTRFEVNESGIPNQDSLTCGTMQSNKIGTFSQQQRYQNAIPS